MEPIFGAKDRLVLLVLAAAGPRDIASKLKRIETSVRDVGVVLRFPFTIGKYKIENIEELRHQSLADKRVTRLSDLVHEALENSAKITCWSCAKMGDATIAASMPAGWRLHSLDTLHEPVCQALAKDCEIHPSVAQVKKQA